MPPNSDPKIKRNKIVLALVLLVVLVVVVSLLGMNKEAGTPSVVNNQNTNVVDMAALIQSTTATKPSEYTKEERAVLVKSVSATKKSTLTDAEREALLRSVSAN
jgi:hypothetical protein